MPDLIERQAALDAIMGQPPEPHYPSWYAAQIEKLPAVQPDHNADISEINKFIDGLEEILADIRERHVDDSVCGLCEYDGAYMGQSGDWCNECPGFDKDDCFKLSDETRKKWIEEIVNTYPDHTADIGKKVSISCGQENDLISRQMAIDALDKRFDDVPMELTTEILQLRRDLRERIPSAQPATNCSEIPNGSDDTISRQAAIDALARMMPHSYTPDGSHPADEEIFRAQEVFADCIEALEILPSAAPSTAHTTETTAETTAPSTVDWIPVERELPEDLAEVNVTWVNHEPEPYYEPIKSKPFTASAVYYEGKWYWYSSVCADVLAEYGRNDVDKVDDTIEITAWKPLPEPYRGGDTE